MPAWLTRLRAPARRTSSLALPSEEKLTLLRSADLFRDLPEADVRRIEGMTDMSQCARGDILYASGETPEALFLLKRGRVEIYRLGLDGKKLILGTVRAGMAFGEMPVTGLRMVGGYAQALEDCTFCVMSRTDVEALILGYPAVALQLIRSLAERVADLEGRLEESSIHRIQSRVAAALLRLATTDGPEIVTTHQHLSETVGAHRETVTRALGELQDRGLIRLSRGRIALLDTDHLRALAEA